MMHPTIRRLLLPLCGTLLSLSVQDTLQAQTFDSSFTPDVPFLPVTHSIQADGKIVIGENRTDHAAVTRMNRFHPHGATDLTFNHYGNVLQSSNAGGIARVDSTSTFMNGNFAISGSFNLIDQTFPANKIVRFNASGKIVYSFQIPYLWSEGWHTIQRTIALPDNRSLVFGNFSNVDNFYVRRGILLLDSKGSIVSSFNPKAEAVTTGATQTIDHRIDSAVMQPDGKFIFAGQFHKMGGKNFPYLARVTASGKLDQSFTPNPSDFCDLVVIQPDGKILVAGDFSQIGGGAASKLARLNHDGSLDNTFSATTNGFVYSMMVRADKRILIGGNFTAVNGFARARIALLEPNGSLSSSFPLTSGTNDTVTSLAIQEDGKVVLCGYFNQVASNARNYLGRLTADITPVSLLEIDYDGTEILWTRDGSVQEVQNAEFRLSYNGSSYPITLGKGQRTSQGWILKNLNLPGNKTFHIQAQGLTQGGVFNASTSVTRSSQNFFRGRPSVTGHPTSQTVIEGAEGVSFTAAFSIQGTPIFQWKRNGKPIPGATASSYIIPGGVTPGHAGKYTCTATTSAGTATTQSATLTVITPLSFLTQPQSIAAKEGQSVTFTTKVKGSSPIYKWYHNGNLLDKTTPNLKISVSAATQGVYKVTVENFAGLIESEEATLYLVDTKPVITPPASQIFVTGQTSSTELTATITSTSPPVIKWLNGKKTVQNATTSTLEFAPVTLTQAGRYTISASNPAGASISPPFDITVVDQTPQSLVLAAGATAKFTARAASPETLQYKWVKVGAPSLEDGGNISGVESVTLALANVTAADAGEYHCEVTSSAGMVESGSWILSVPSDVPVITTPLTLPPAMLNVDYDYTVLVDPDPALKPSSFVATGLPKGLKIDNTGRITGKPTQIGNFTVSITAANPKGPGATVADLPLAVNIIPTPLVGSFIAFIPPEGNSPVFWQGARLDLVTTTKGEYSGKVTLGNKAFSFKKGKLKVGHGINGTNEIQIPRKGLPPLTLTFTLDDITHEINGTLTDSIENGILAGWKNVWSKTNKAESYRGYYTTALSAPTPNPGIYDIPDGSGYVTVNVTETGTVTQKGILPDGTAFASSSTVSPTGKLKIHNPLYKNTGGMLQGHLQIDIAGSAPAYLDNSIHGNAVWSKRPLPFGVNYAYGFDSVELTATGAKYTKPATGNFIGSNPSSVTPDISIEFSGALIEQSIDQSPNALGHMTAKNAFKLSTTSTATSLKFNAATGIFTGAFTLSDKRIKIPGYVYKRKAKVFGILVRVNSNSEGNGYGAFTLNQFPGSAVAEVLSGRVSINVP